MIEIKNVSKTFHLKREVKAVKNVTLAINDGEIFGIVGYSGAGKSTLIRLVNQLERVDSGEIIINGEDITKLKGKELRAKRQKIGMIFQNFNLLWSKTVLDNVAFPLVIAGINKKEARDKAIDIIKEVGLEDKINTYPSALSGGQKQRVAIARSLILNPEILLCDEATSALDPKTTDEILELLKRINRERKLTILLITHQMETVQKVCHRLAVMADGEIVESGTVEDVFTNPQNQLAKELIQTVDTGLNVKEMAYDLKKRYPEGHLIRLTFESTTSEKPVIYEISVKLNIPISIVSANIKNTQAGPLGVMYIYIEKRNNIDILLDELIKLGVKVEVI